MRRALLLFGLALLGGCNDSTSPTEMAAAQLAINRVKWSRADTYYEFTMRRSCECAVTEAVRVTVDHDTIVSAFTVANHTAVDRRSVQTINQLFDLIDRAIASHADVLNVRYDPNLGFPSQIDYDGSKLIADDETTIMASEVFFPHISAASQSSR